MSDENPSRDSNGADPTLDFMSYRLVSACLRARLGLDLQTHGEENRLSWLQLIRQAANRTIIVLSRRREGPKGLALRPRLILLVLDSRRMLFPPFVVSKFLTGNQGKQTNIRKSSIDHIGLCFDTTHPEEFSFTLSWR